jgi:flavodoxin
MKKILSLVFALVLAFSLTAYRNAASANSTPSQAPSTPATKGTGKILIAYFSMPETDNPKNMTKEEENSAVVIDGEVLGNTQYVANIIQENTGADAYRIEPQTPYPLDHRALVDQAKEEQNQNSRPAIKTQIENIEEYDTIFLGYPNWWGDMPMILYSFLEQYDLSGKTVIPFNTNGGSGFSDTIKTIAKLQPGATVRKDGFAVSRDDVQDAEPGIITWLKALGF